jgi:hypothetical protein
VTLRHRVSVLASVIQEDFSIDATNAELSQLFGHSGGWTQGMMARYEQYVQVGHPLSRGWPRLVESEQEQAPIQFAEDDRPKGNQRLAKTSSIA